MKILLLICYCLFLLAVSSCDLDITPRREREISTVKRTFLVEIEAEELVAAKFLGETIITKIVHIPQYSIKTDINGFVTLYVRAVKRIEVKVNVGKILAGRMIKNSNGEIEDDDIFSDSCIAYDQDVKSREIGNQREVEMKHCDQAIRELLASNVVFGVWIREFVFGGKSNGHWFEAYEDLTEIEYEMLGVH